MIKTKAGDMSDEGKVVIELASELDGENGFPVGQSEPNLAKNGEEWLLQREYRGRVVSGQPGGKGARSVFVAEMDEIPGEDGEDLAEGREDGSGEPGPPELVYLEHEAFGTQYKARQKIAEVRKLRQYYQKPDTEEKKRWLSEQMKKNPCHACGQYGGPGDEIEVDGGTIESSSSSFRGERRGRMGSSGFVVLQRGRCGTSRI